MSTITARVTTTVSPIPALRHRATVVNFPVDQDDFVAKYEATNDHLSGTTVGELNAIGDQIDMVATQMNTVAGEVNTNASTATTKAGEALASANNASASETAAAASAASAAAIAGAFVGTSTTSLLIATGSKSFTTQTGEQYTAGIFLTAVSQANTANYMFGQVTSYNSGTGALVLDVQVVGGSGTYADWNLSLVGARGATGPAGATFTGGSLTSALNEARATVASSATTADIWGAQGNLIDFTGTATVTAFPTAPQAGARRELVCAGACSFTAGANMLIDGVPSGSTVTCAIGDTVVVRAITTTQFKLTRLKADGTAQVSSSIGGGGTTSAVPLTLTSASVAQQSLTATAFNQAVTLPDATTLSKGVTVFGLYNNSKFPILIKDSSGALIGFISSFKHVICSLADNSTAKGVWNLSGESLVEMLGFADINIGVANSSIDYVKSISISTDKYLILCHVSSASLVAVVYDAVNGLFGTPALVRSASIASYLNAIKVSNDVALVVSCASTAFQAVVLTVTGTTIAVGTAASLTLGGAIADTNYGEKITLTQVGTSYIAGYAREITIAEIVAMTVSGATVTIGTPKVQTGTGIAPFMYDMGSGIAMVLSQSVNLNIYAIPVTVSGVTLTAGTEASITSNKTGFSCRRLDSGRIAIAYLNTDVLWGAIVSLSATTATSSIVQLGTVALASVQYFNGNKVGNQLIVACGAPTANLNTINVLTDNAGTAVAGTSYEALTITTNTGMQFLGTTPTALYVMVNTVVNQNYQILKVSINGNNPVVTTVGYIKRSSNTDPAYAIPSYAQGLYDGERYGREFLNGAKFKTFVGPANTAGIFGIRDDAIVPMLRPMYIILHTTTVASNPSDDVLVMAAQSSATNSLQLQIARAV